MNDKILQNIYDYMQDIKKQLYYLYDWRKINRVGIHIKPFYINPQYDIIKYTSKTLTYKNGKWRFIE